MPDTGRETAPERRIGAVLRAEYFAVHEIFQGV